MMTEVSTLTPVPVAGQRGADWRRWLDGYAASYATAVAQMTVRDFPAWVTAHIEVEEDGETATESHVAIVTLLIAHLGAARGFPRVPGSLADALMMTEALVLERALAPLQTDAVIGRYTMEDPALGAHASPCGAALHSWLTALLARPGASPP